MYRNILKASSTTSNNQRFVFPY